jgi:hypothetical protein
VRVANGKLEAGDPSKFESAGERVRLDEVLEKAWMGERRLGTTHI